MALRTSSLFRSMALPAGSAGVAATLGYSVLERGTSKATTTLVNRSPCMATPLHAARFRGGGALRKMSTETTAAAAAQSTTVKSSNRSLLQWYEGHLQSRPVFTKMVTGAFLWGLGDGVAQLVPKLAPTTDGDNNKNDTDEPYDFIRTGRAVLFGFAIHAPTSHLHFNFLEWLTVRCKISGLGIPIFKAFMEQFVYWSWISNSMYHGAMGAMQGMTPSQIYHRIEDVLWETQVAQWKFWIPIQLLNFQFIPVRHQLNVVLLTSIVWTALLSAWYPPAKKEKAVVEEDTAPEPSSA